MNDEIANLIGYWDWENKTANQCADSILSLPSLREALEKAEKWERVEELAAYYHADRCAGCPERDAKTGWCSGRCSTADAIVKAFKEAPDGN